MSTMNRLRKFADSTPAASLLLNPRVRKAAASAAALRFYAAAPVVDHPLAFIRRDLARQPTYATYRVRGAPVTVTLRHDVGAAELLFEIMASECYRPTPPMMGLLPDPPRILDVGANVGVFSAYCLTLWPDALITCVEPDPENLFALRSFAAENPTAKLNVVEACAGTHAGQVNFVSGHGEGSHIGASGTPTPMVDIFELLQEADFAKIDIEGGEWEIIEDPRLAEVSGLVLVMEYHRRFPFDKGAASAASTALVRAGFQIDNVQENYWGHGLLWAHKD